MSFIKFIRSIFVKEEVKPIAEPVVETVAAPIVEIPEAVAEQIAGEAVVVKKKKYVKKKK